MQLNRGISTDGLLKFSEIAQFSGVSNTDWRWEPLIADFGNDGLKDIFITNGYLKDFRNLDFVYCKANKAIAKAHRENKEVHYVSLLQEISSIKVHNYIFRNENGLQFENKIEEWERVQMPFG